MYTLTSPPPSRMLSPADLSLAMQVINGRTSTHLHRKHQHTHVINTSRTRTTHLPHLMTLVTLAYASGKEPCISGSNAKTEQSPIHPAFARPTAHSAVKPNRLATHCQSTYYYLFYYLDIQAAAVYSCVTLGVTDSPVLISLGIPLPRSVFYSSIYYSYSYKYTLGIPLPTAFLRLHLRVSLWFSCSGFVYLVSP